MGGEQRPNTAAVPPLTVVFTCEWCGERVELSSSEAGPEIADVQAFLAQHRECIREQLPRQRP